MAANARITQEVQKGEEEAEGQEEEKDEQQGEEEREEDKNKEEKEQEENEEEKKVLNKRKGMSRRRKRKTWDEGQERREGQGELMQNEMCELDHLITMPLGSSHTFALRDTSARQLAELRMQA